MLWQTNLPETVSKERSEEEELASETGQGSRQRCEVKGVQELVCLYLRPRNVYLRILERVEVRMRWKDR